MNLIFLHPSDRSRLAVVFSTLGIAWGTWAASITVDVAKPGANISPMLWGVFFEDINHSTDGGIYPELVRNRSFEDAEQPASWKLNQPDGGKPEMAIDSSRPVNPFNRRSLRVKLDGSASLANEGFWGMSVEKGKGYTFRCAARAGDGFKGPLQVVLRSQQGAPLARASIEGFGDAWRSFAADLTSADTDPKASLAIELQGSGRVWLDMVSVMPRDTWKGHGLRPDLCEMIAALKPSFLRFPGGCWVEGDDLAHMYHWKKTIGDISQREPLWNIWQYWATHGLGYHEYLQLSEDLGAEPLFCINVGMSHRENVPLDQMGQWVQDALDAIEYANGPVDSVWGGLRAKNGHPAPFNLKYLEIGNENGGPAYAERWALFHKAIKARYPKIQLIVNHWMGGYPQQPTTDLVDEHYYSDPEFFMREAGKYDRYDRKGPKIFVGEYAVTQRAGLGNLRGAIGEAAFMTGMERNGDVVAMAAYAPLFCNANHKRWPINLINFDSSRAFGIPSYYVQKLFSEHRGDVVLPTAVDSPLAEASAKGGAIGVGTWNTAAEFKDLKVTAPDGKVMFTSDFSQGSAGWKLLGDGAKWSTQDGALRQTAEREFIRAVAGDRSWTDYTFELKARKISGREGFLILFHIANDEDRIWWNLGGWNNSQHAVEMGGTLDPKRAAIETGRWYDIKIEVRGNGIKCYLDGQLVHDVQQQRVKALYASASRAKAGKEVILKVVNTSATPVTTDLNLKGVKRLPAHAETIVLTSESPEDENTLESPTKVFPKVLTIPVSGPKFSHAFPGNSLTILRLAADK
jgi:alpha-L-arabinofuranosidase